MAINPQSVQDINSAIITNIESNIGTTIPILPVAFVRVLAKAFAAVIVLLYKYTGFIWLQLYPFTASPETTTIAGTVVTPLNFYGELVGAGQPVPGVAAELTATVTVVNQTGAPIDAGTPLVYEPSGVVYLTTATVLRDAPTKVINIVASSDQTGGGGIGAVGNLQVGDIVSFANPLPDIERDTPIASVVTSGEDAEPTEQYRQRIVDRFQKPPQGGALADYEIWAEEAAGIINAYPYTGPWPGTVTVYCEADPVSSGSPDGFPTAPQLQAALDSINLDVAGRATRRPANALAFTQSITRKEFEVEVYGLDAPDPTATEAAITDALEDLFATYEPFIGGLTVTPRDRVTLSEVSGVVFDVAQANSATFSSVTLRAQVGTASSYSAFISASSNDASQTGSTVTLGGTVLAMTGATTIGVRFTSVSVPADATVTDATLTFTSASVKNPYSVLTVRGEAEPNPGTFTVAANDITDRTTTIASVEWIPDAWAVDDQKSIDVSDIITDILSVPGWASGNAMALIVSSATGSDREARSYDDNPAQSPQLVINYSSPSVAFQAVDVVTLGEGEKAKVTSVTFP